MATNKFSSDSAPDPIGAYPHARVAGNFLFLSGVGPRIPGTNEVPGNEYDQKGRLISYNFEAQCHSVFENVVSILSACKSGWGDLVDVTAFLTNMQSDFDCFNRIWALYASEHQPCRTTVEVSALPTPIAIELKCIAHRTEGF